MDQTHSIEIPVSDFDQQLLPPDTRQPGTAAFRDAVSAFVQAEFKGFAGRVQVVIDNERLRISWQASPKAPKPLAEAIRLLKQGDYPRGIQLLRFLVAHRPQDAILRWNLGMALSDQGRLDEAVTHLRGAINLDPRLVDARVALAVALARQRNYDEAIKVLETILAEAPDHILALRNLAGCLMPLNRDLPRAEDCLRKVVAVTPADQAMWLALAQALEIQGKLKEADEAYGKAVAINPVSEIAEQARRARTAISQRTFRQPLATRLRPDALAYCQEALERFEPMDAEQVRRVAVETAMLGSKGLNPNDPTTRYRLKSLSGEFSGLAIVCLMYVAWKQIEPSADIGFDLSREYEAALELFGRKR